MQPKKLPPTGRIMQSGPTLQNWAESMRRSGQLTASYPLEAVRSSDGYHLIDRRLPGFWVVIYKLGSYLEPSQGTSAFPNGTPAYAYDGYRLIVDKNLDIQQESRLFFDRNRNPLIEMSENPDVPDTAVAYAVPAPDGSHYEFVWGGTGSEDGGYCRTNVCDLFECVNGQAEARDACLAVADAQGRIIGHVVLLNSNGFCSGPANPCEAE